MTYRQKGAALLISLMLLVVLTLLAVSAINLSTVNLRIVNNMQSRVAAEVRAQDAVDQAISNMVETTFYKPDEEIKVNFADAPTGSATIGTRLCLAAVPFVDDSYTLQNLGLAKEQTLWMVTAEYEGDDGAKSAVTQGTNIILPGGNCINPEGVIP